MSDWKMTSTRGSGKGYHSRKESNSHQFDCNQHQLSNWLLFFPHLCGYYNCVIMANIMIDWKVKWHRSFKRKYVHQFDIELLLFITIKHCFVHVQFPLKFTQIQITTNMLSTFRRNKIYHKCFSYMVSQHLKHNGQYP